MNRLTAALIAAILLTSGCAEVEDLVTGLRHPDQRTRQRSALKLSSAGQPAVTALVGLLADSDVEIRLQAIHLLGQNGLAAREAVAPLARILEEGGPRERSAAAWSLGQMGPTVAPVLAAALGSESRDIRVAAAWSLGLMGADARHAVQALTAALADDEPTVRRISADALGRIGTWSRESAGEIASLLLDEDESVRAAALSALEALGPNARRAMEEIWQLLEADDPDLRSKAAAALGAMGRSAGDRSARILGAMLSDLDAGVRYQAMIALSRLGSMPKFALADFLVVLEESAKEVGEDAAARVLNSFGSALAGGIAELLESYDPFVRARAAWAMGTLVRNKYTVPSLVDALADSEAAVRLAALRALARVGSPARTGMMEIARSITDEDQAVREAAAETLHRVFKR